MNARPKHAKTNGTLEKLVKESGCYRDFDGLILLNQRDVNEFLDWYRATPRPSPAHAEVGEFGIGVHARPGEEGHICLFHAIGKRDFPVFIGWAPKGGAGRLLDQVQFGCPWRLNPVIEDNTPEAARELRAMLGEKNMRIGKGSWFVRNELVDSVLERIALGMEDDGDGGEG